MNISLTAILYKGMLLFVVIGGAFILTKLIGRYLPNDDNEENEDEPKGDSKDV